MVRDYRNLEKRLISLQGEVDSIYSRLSDINSEISNLMDEIGELEVDSIYSRLRLAIVSANAVPFDEKGANEE